MTSGTFSYPSQRNTGYKVTAEDWNELVDDLTYIGRNHSIYIQKNYDLSKVSYAMTVEFEAEGNNLPGKYIFVAGANVESCHLITTIPQNFGGSQSLSFGIYSSDTASGTCVFSVKTAPINATVNPSWGTTYYGTFTLSGTAGVTKYGTINISDVTNYQPGNELSILFSRVGTAAVDNGGTVNIHGLTFNYWS